MHCPHDNVKCVHGDKCRLEHQCRANPDWHVGHMEVAGYRMTKTKQQTLPPGKTTTSLRCSNAGCLHHVQACVDAGRCLDFEPEPVLLGKKPIDVVFGKKHEKVPPLPEQASRQTIPVGRDIGWAVASMREGKLVRRAGWNGKGMWLFYVKGGIVTAGRYEAHGALGARQTMPRAEYIAMKTAQDYVIPWLCSQADLLAQDWELAS